jgi:surface protein
MWWMFYGANAFSQNLSGWDVSKVTVYDGFWEGKPSNYKPLFAVA